MHGNTHTHIYTHRTFSRVFLHECNHCAGRPLLPLHKYIAVVNKEICCVGTVKYFFFFSDQQFKNCNTCFNEGFFNVGRAWKGGKYTYFQHEIYVGSVNGLLLPSSPPSRTELSCTGRKKQSSKFGATRNHQLNDLSLSSRVTGVRANISNKQCWNKVRAWTTPPPNMNIKQLGPSLLGYTTAVAFVSCQWPHFCANTIFKPKASIRK